MRGKLLRRIADEASKDKGAIPAIVLYYSDNRPKVVTNELGRLYEHRHHQHPLFAMRCIVTPRPTAYADTIEIPLKFLLTFLQLLIRFHVIHSSTILHLSDSRQTRLDRNQWDRQTSLIYFAKSSHDICEITMT